jgi:hypothetical protein
MALYSAYNIFVNSASYRCPEKKSEGVRSGKRDGQISFQITPFPKDIRELPHGNINSDTILMEMYAVNFKFIQTHNEGIKN